MSEVLIKELKATMGFRKQTGNCKDCKHCGQGEALVMDQSWSLQCELIPITTFTVTENDTCNRWEERGEIK